MGEIKIISTMPESLSVKPIPAIMGEMNIICDNHVYIVVVPAVRHSAPCCLFDTSLLHMPNGTYGGVRGRKMK